MSTVPPCHSATAMRFPSWLTAGASNWRSSSGVTIGLIAPLSMSTSTRRLRPARFSTAINVRLSGVNAGSFKRAPRAVCAPRFDAPLLPQLFHANTVDVFRRRVDAERHDVAGVVVHEESQLVDAAGRREPR